MALQHLRSGTANKRPIPTAMSDGQLAVNTNLASPGLFFKDSNGDLVKAGPVHVGTTAPNASPASTAATALVANTIYQILTIGTSDFTAVGASANTVGVVFTATGTTTGTGTVSGQQGNEKGEQWLDTTNSLYVMKVYDGTGWRVTDSISLANGSAAAPSLHFGSDTNTGLFRSAADELAVTTAGTQRVTVDSSGNVVVGATAFNSGFSSLAQIEASGTEGGIVINSSDTSANKYSRLAFTKGNAAGNEGLIRYNVNDYHMAFYTNGAEKLRIDSSGRLLINHTADTAPAGYSSKLQLCDTSYEGASILIRRDQNNGSAPVLLFAKTRSSSKGGSTAIQNGDLCGQIIWYVGDGTDANSQVAFMQAAVDGTPGSNDTPGRLEFHTTADGASLSTERMRIDSSGNVGIGNAAPAQKLHVAGNIRFGANTTYYAEIEHDAGSTGANIYNSQDTGGHIFKNSGTEKLRIDNSGNVLFSQSASSSPYPEQKLKWSNDSTTANGFYISQGTDRNGKIWHEQGLDIQFATNNTERMRIDSNGKLVVGATSFLSGANSFTQAMISGTDGGLIINSTNTSASSYCRLMFTPNGHITGNEGMIRYNTNDYHMAFWTQGNERARIGAVGLNVGRTAYASVSTNGHHLNVAGWAHHSVSNEIPLYINRNVNDGGLISFYQAGINEGSISVSGSTVSYNGAHLSRWAQLPGGVERAEILRGSVLSNLDEMCEWGTENNEQLNRMKVSDVEGDKNVSGVFQGWDDDDDTYINDFYCAMTGDFVIRIAQGTTVARGDLLMSAGDGTAKPQDDDIVRSKTIAKVTSTTVSTTYSDNSYCVPCVLMAC